MANAPGCCRRRCGRPAGSALPGAGDSTFSRYARRTLLPQLLDLSVTTSRSRKADVMSAEEQQPTASEAGATLMRISDTMVRLFKEQFGRGPTKARTYWTGPDAVTCFLEDTLTAAEHNLLKLGEHQRLRDTRMVFQYATVREFCEPVERITGRTVRSFHSSIDTEVDGLSAETFLFYPEGQEGPSRIERAER
jgi:uncharacterized protein YbcI